MTDPQTPEEKTVTVRTAEIAVALTFMAVAGVVIQDSLSIGAGWGDFGPQSGFFPFYVGVAMLIASTLTLITHIAKTARDGDNFVGKTQLGLVLKVFVPTAVFAALIAPLGIYVAAALYLTFFMWWIGGYALYKSAPMGVAVALFFFWLFEKAFVVPLPKGPLEAALGL